MSGMSTTSSPTKATSEGPTHASARSSSNAASLSRAPCRSYVCGDAVGAERFRADDARLPQFGPRPNDALREVRQLAGDDERVYLRLGLRQYRRVEVRRRRLYLLVNGGGRARRRLG